MTTPARSLLGKVRASLLLFWRVFWKVTAAATALFAAVFLTWHRDDLAGPAVDVILGVIVVLGYCAFFAAWMALAAGVFAVAWRWCGAWIIVPLVGAALGAAAAVGLTWAILRGLDLRGAGLHGGGDIAAFLIVGLLAVSAAVGALCGGLLTGLAALVFALAARRR